jgi:integrase
MAELSPLVLGYLEHLRAEAVSPNTIASRARALRSLEQVAPALTASREQVEEWWALRRELDLSPATRANDLAGIRAFYKWCQIWEHRPDDPTRRITAPQPPKGLPRPISRADLHQLLSELPDELRRAVVLGAYAGLRVSEAAALDWRDIDVEARRARVTGKGGKTRLVALSALLIDQLLPDTGGNVVRPDGDPYTAGVLQHKVNAAIRSCGVDATFHQLRHRYGTLAYQATGDLIAVGRQMGHSSPVTTAIYAAASDEQADVIAEAVAR